MVSILPVPAAMKTAPFLPLALSASCLGGSLSIESRTLPDTIRHEILPAVVFEKGFYPAHAPAGVYTQQQIDAALAGLAPMEKGTLSSTTAHRFTGEILVSTTSVIDPNGALHGADFTGDPFDPESWLVPGPADLTVEIRTSAARLLTSRDFTEREFVRKPDGSAAVDVAVWTRTQATDLVESAAPILKYSPQAMPGFLPAELVQRALGGAVPGQEIPLATGYGVLPLGEDTGATTETVHIYGAQYGVDYFGDPSNYLGWFAIGEERMQVSAHRITEKGRRFLDQTAQYVLVAPDGDGQVIRNPKLTVVTEVTDTTRAWSKVYFTPGNIPAEVDPADAATLAAKVSAGNAGMALHTIVDTPGDTSRTVGETIDAHGAVHGVDYSGDPADPATWTALTANDVIADRLETVTLTTETEADHVVHMLYRETPGGTGQLRLVENDVVGRDILRVTRRYLDLPLDLGEELPEGLTAADIARALAWADPGETVVPGQTRVRTLLSTQTTPLPDIIDTNGWTHGVDFTGDPGDVSTWEAAGPADVYIDRYHPVTRTRDYMEVVTNHLVTAPAGLPAASPSLKTVSTDPGPPRAVGIEWDSPYGMQFGVETSVDLIHFTPVPGLYKSTGRPLRFSGFFDPSQPAGFLRVKRR